MSSRVQKGGTVFRPATKARSRTTETPNRQLSVSREVPISQPLISLPDPCAVPDALPQTHAVSSAVVSPVVIPVKHSLTKSTTVTNGVAIIGGTPIVIASSVVPPPAQATESRFHPASNGGVRIDSTGLDPSTQDPSRKRKPACDSSTPPPKKARKSRRPTTPAFDAGADVGEDLDPTLVTMAALCEDTGRGRLSTKASQILQNHQTWKRSNREKRVKMRQTMEAKKYGHDEDPDVPQEIISQGAPLALDTPGPRKDTSFGPPAQDISGNGFDYSQDVSTSQFNVQVRIDSNGETILDEESLFVDRTAEEDTTNYVQVEESDVTKFVNSGTYSRRFRCSRWSAEETELFYQALSQFGENYELISYVLPGRDRKACKNKFKTEDKRNPSRINHCLNTRLPYDIQTLSRMTGKDFSGPTPEIRAPARLSLTDPEKAERSLDPASTNSGHALPVIEGSGEEVLGDISSFVS